MNEEEKQFDLIIIGGGISATLLCLSIFKRTKDFNILIIEKSDRFSQKVGESVVDLTAVFLKSLEIDHLLTEQVHKTGVRFLFNETNSSDLGDVAEFASPTLPGAIKGYHLNRSVVDQKLLEEVQQKGGTVYRPAEIVATSFKEFENKLSVRVEGQIKHVQSKWVVDATGRGRFVAKKLNWNNKPIGLNTGAIMAHFQNIAPSAEWDTCKNHYWDGKAVGLRDFSTTHLMRKHSWWWVIRLNETTTSIGVVFDKNKVKFEDYKTFFQEQITTDAQLVRMTQYAKQGEIRYIKNLAYVSERIYSKGIALIGESGAFLDPFISPGLEMIGQQTIWLSKLLVKEKETGKFEQHKWERYSQLFYQSYASRLKIYKTAYHFMHSYDLFKVWLMQGNFAYFGKIVFPSVVFNHRIKYPLRFNMIENVAVHYFGKRLKAINQKRIKSNRGAVYQKNELTYSSVRVPKGVLFPFIPFHLLFKALWAYWLLEVKELKFRKK